MLSAEERPAVILATAHDNFAIDELAPHAVDFLVKPFESERLHVALQRAVHHVRLRRAGDLMTRMAGLVGQSREAGAPRLVVRSEGRVIFLEPSEIEWVEAENNYSALHLSNAKRLLVRETLSSLEGRLSRFGFARVNRSSLVRLDRVQELVPAKFGDSKVLLRNGVSLSLSRKLRGRIEELGARGR
jgi:two-component system LytT family response regulator